MMHNAGKKVPELISFMVQQVEYATHEVGGPLGIYLDTYDFDCYPYVIKRAVQEIRKLHPDWYIEEMPSRGDTEYDFSVLIGRHPTAEDWQELDRRQSGHLWIPTEIIMHGW